MEKEFTIYVGCGLTQAPEEFIEGIDGLKVELRRVAGIKIIDFIGLKGGTAREVYLHDTRSVMDAGGILAVVDQPSIGLGMEIATAIQYGKPVLAVAHRVSRVTRMIIGAAEDPDNKVVLHYYDNFLEIPKLVTEVLVPMIE